MASGGYRPNAGRPRVKPKADPNVQKNPRGRPRKDGTVKEVVAEVKPKHIEVLAERTMSENPEHKEIYKKMTPLEYALNVMNDLSIDEGRRDRMAIAAMPFVHAKKGETNKREATQQDAEKAVTGKFSPSPAPKLKVV